MAWKITRAIGAQVRRTAIGRMKGRGGAGAVAAAAALMLALAIMGTAFTATACSPDIPTPDAADGPDRPVAPEDWNYQEKSSPVPAAHGCGPSRLPC